MQHHATAPIWCLNEALNHLKYPYDSETAEEHARPQQWRNLTGGTFFCEELMASSSRWDGQLKPVQIVKRRPLATK